LTYFDWTPKDRKRHLKAGDATAICPKKNCGVLSEILAAPPKWISPKWID
jgi:hypothetical protein